jgi:hypothetical protein
LPRVFQSLRHRAGDDDVSVAATFCPSGRWMFRLPLLAGKPSPDQDLERDHGE